MECLKDIKSFVTSKHVFCGIDMWFVAAWRKNSYERSWTRIKIMPKRLICYGKSSLIRVNSWPA